MDDPLFWAKVDTSGECWVWTGAVFKSYGRSGSGYGATHRVYPDGRKEIRAHRWSFWLANGQSPAGMLVCHHCDNPPCVRPSHLFLGTNVENTRDRDAKGRGNHPGKRWEACKYGHPFTTENRMTNGRWSKCRTCHNERNRRERAHQGACT